MRRFTFSEGASNKFWHITLQGNKFTVNFGKIGTAGQTQVKEFADDAAAKKEYDKLVAEKLKKGYEEQGGSPAPAPAPPTPAAPPAAEPAAKPAKGKKSAEPPAPAPAPAPPPVPAPAPAPKAAAAPAERTFEFSDASSHKFWNIRREGTGVTVVYGRIGTAGTTQLKTFNDDAAAAKEHDKLVAEKLKKGYRETTPAAAPQPTSLREALEAALVENPDDMASHSAYADYLTEQGDPLGEFIAVQLALEDEKKTPAERKKLKARETLLLNAHQEKWLGDLGPWLVGDAGKQGEDEYSWLTSSFSFSRGWLSTLRVDRCSLAFSRVLAKAPQTRLLRSLEIVSQAYDEEEALPEDNVPDNVYRPYLFPLIKSPYLSNVRTFILGENIPEDDEQKDTQNYYSCHTGGDGAVGVIKQMPRVEELYLFARPLDTDQLFSLKTLKHLRVLEVYHNHKYPLGRLAKNESLSSLTHLLFHPHGAEHDDMDDDETGGGYLRHPAVKSLLESDGVPSLTHLRLRMSDAGDKLIATLVASGRLKTLKYIDLRHGRICDKGAQALAKCADAKNLDHLDLCNNQITAEGVKALRGLGIRSLRVENQRAPGEGEAYEYLSMGDAE